MFTQIEQIAKMLRKVAHIYLVGDGGSASMADHLACDLLKNCELPAISLCSNSAMITAISNDYSFNQIFSLQLSILFKDEDVLIAFSGSGKSINLLYALEVVGRGKSIVIAGNGGGLMKEKAGIFFDLESNDQLECEDRMSVFCHSLVKELRKDRDQ